VWYAPAIALLHVSFAILAAPPTHPTTEEGPCGPSLRSIAVS